MTKRITSLLLALVMVVGLLPSLPFHAHADYSDGEDCPICGHYHWDDHRCEGCGGCSDVCDSEEYETWHCSECGKCLANEGYDTWCGECGKCFECAYEDGEHCQSCMTEDDVCPTCHLCGECANDIQWHCVECQDCFEDTQKCDRDHAGDPEAHCTGESLVCSECGACFYDDEDDFCEQCSKCRACAWGESHCATCNGCFDGEVTLCEAGSAAEDVNLCTDCCEGANLHCEECGEHAEDWCPLGGEGTHCRECYAEYSCLSCGECTLCSGLELCELCGECEECCREKTRAAGCEHDWCIESSDYDEHLCDLCGQCPIDEKCPDCGWCESCAEGSSHCEHGVCKESSEWADHACPECGECPGDEEFCETCGLCPDCAEGNTHCEHGVCTDSTDWNDHACPNCGECPADFLCDEDDLGLCENCDQEYHESEDALCAHIAEDAWQSNSSIHWKKCAKCKVFRMEIAEHTVQRTRITDPDAAAKKNGLDRLSCSVCGRDLGTETGPYAHGEDHTYDRNGKCTICGTKAEGLYIITQPKDFNCTVPKESDILKATFTVRVGGGTGVYSYQWYQKMNTIADEPVEHQLVPGARADGPSLTIWVPEDSCDEEYSYRYYCVITGYDKNGTLQRVETQVVQITARHSYKLESIIKSGAYIRIPRPSGEEDLYYVSEYHHSECYGCHKAKAGSTQLPHKYGPWVIARPAETTLIGHKYRVCKDCGYRDHQAIPRLPADHVHQYTLVKTDPNYHWMQCSCSRMADMEGNPIQSALEVAYNPYREVHQLQWAVTTRATEDHAGVETGVCTVCGYEDTRAIAKLPHEHKAFTQREYLVLRDADVLEATASIKTVFGKSYSVAVYSAKEDYFGTSGTSPISCDKGQKVLGLDENYHWFYCKRGDLDPKTGEPVVLGKAKHDFSSWRVVSSPTADTDGMAKATCSVCKYEVSKKLPKGNDGYFFTVYYGTSHNNTTNEADPTTVKSGNEITITAKKRQGLTFVNWTVVYGSGVTLADANATQTTFTVPTLSGDSANGYRICIRANYSACEHDYQSDESTAKAPTCLAAGKAPDTVCTKCGAVSAKGAEIPALGHETDENKWVKVTGGAKSATCKEQGKTGYSICGRTVNDKTCEQVMKKSETLPKTDNHVAGTPGTTVEATCTKPGTQRVTCTVCNKFLRNETIPAAGHSFGSWGDYIAATPAKAGRQVRECSVCWEKEYRDSSYLVPRVDVTVAAPARDAYPANAVGDGVVNTQWDPAVSGRFAPSTAYTVTISLEAGTAKLYDAATRFYLNGVELTPVTPITGTAEEAKLCFTFPKTAEPPLPPVGPKPEKPEEPTKPGGTDEPAKPAHPFTDVPAGSYYEDAVIWAAGEGITDGTSATTFAPEAPCTRAQVVTFLWRAAGSPEPKAMSSFTDVAADSYYAKAVAWAVENGITSGTGDGKFSPDATCTRAQAVTFLYRASGAPAVSGNAAFSDVAADAYYAAAVRWAEQNGITGGIGGGLFGADLNCTRGQIVTFLYRTYQSK